ncbi:hypothetical protein NH340_JMT06665 [Sarcoptes scabiei]|nr:tRNA-specific adenosine deaminase 2-like protein [Sarcoptes scabiei]UXI20722.1 hypothetical protein NH340_JMT06665 [Sarcoptes scabiei]
MDHGNLIDSKLIELCFEEAEKGLANKEVPVGCVFLEEIQANNNSECGGHKIIAKSYNRSNEFKSALKHAEIDCINQIVMKYPNDYEELFKRSIVLLTLEPCIMCCRILRRLQIKKVFYGASNERFGGAGSVLSVHCDQRIQDPELHCVSGSLDRERSIKLLQKFYDQTNENAPKNKSTN